MNVVIVYRQCKENKHSQWIAQVSLPWRRFPTHLFGEKEERKATTNEHAATSGGVLIMLQKEVLSVRLTQSDTFALDCFILFPHSLHVQLDPT